VIPLAQRKKEKEKEKTKKRKAGMREVVFAVSLST